MRTVTARRTGTCPLCSEPITPGQVVTPTPARRTNTWCHVECHDQYRRDVAADDLDALTMGFGR